MVNDGWGGAGLGSPGRSHAGPVEQADKDTSFRNQMEEVIQLLAGGQKRGRSQALLSPQVI